MMNNIEQTLQDVAGLSPDDMRRWITEHIYETRYLLAYLMGYAGIKTKENVVNVTVLPPCEVCGRAAGYRAKDHDGYWRDMCERCFPILGVEGRKLELVKL